MSKKEMMHVLGGSGTGSGLIPDDYITGGIGTGSGSGTGSGNGSSDGICAATSGSPTAPISYCSNSAERAEYYAADNGWWCCNCESAISFCKDKL